MLIAAMDAIGSFVSEGYNTLPYLPYVLPLILIVNLLFLILFIHYSFSNRSQFLFYKVDGDRVIGKKWLFFNEFWGYLMVEFQISDIFQIMVMGTDEEDLRKKKNGRFTGIFCDDQAYFLFFPHKLITDLNELIPEGLLTFGKRGEIEQKVLAWNTRDFQTYN